MNLSVEHEARPTGAQKKRLAWLTVAAAGAMVALSVAAYAWYYWATQAVNDRGAVSSALSVVLWTCAATLLGIGLTPLAVAKWFRRDVPSSGPVEAGYDEITGQSKAFENLFVCVTALPWVGFVIPSLAYYFTYRLGQTDANGKLMLGACVCLAIAGSLLIGDLNVRAERTCAIRRD